MKSEFMTFIQAAVAGVAGAWLFEFILANQDLVNPDIFGLEDRVGHHAGGNFPGTGATSPGGKTDTPGWYTLQGHHHCGVDANGAFSPGCLCSVSPETRMYWQQDGELKFGTIEDLFLDFHNITSAGKDFHVLSGYRTKRRPYETPRSSDEFTRNTAEVGFSKIKDVMYHGVRPVWKVELRNGKSIEITENHSVFSPKHTGNSVLIPKTLDKLDKVASVDNYSEMTGKSLPIDKCVFMGLWMADGSYHKSRNKPNVQISTGNNPEVVQWLREFARKYSRQYSTGKTTSVLCYSHNRKGGDCVLSSIVLGKEIEDSFGDVDSYTKRVPKEIFLADERSICSFLRGYFSGDGCVVRDTRGYHSIACNSVNRSLMDDVSILLDRIGITHNIKETRRRDGLMMNKWPQKTIYEIRITYGSSVRKYMEKIGFIQDKKCVRNESREKKDSPISIRQIRKITYIGEKPVYDISVESEAFVGNGILCHNTDPKKCKGNAGTGAAYCAAHQSECWPTNEKEWCAYWYASDEKYCNLCNGWAYTGPAGSGAKPCPAGATGG